MMVFVKMPDGSTISVDVNNRHAPGQDCLDEVCRRLDIIETDYFGLQYQSRKGERLWLNLRNPIQDQVPFPGIAQTSICLSIRVKFHVPPHVLQQVSTRHLFYQDAKLSLKEGTTSATDKEAARLVALILQAEFGDLSPDCHYPSLTSLLPSEYSGEELRDSIQPNYVRLRGMKQSSAEQRLLQEIIELKDYGTDIFMAYQTNGPVRTTREPNVQIRVGSNVIHVKESSSSEVQRINVEHVVRSAVDGKCCFITHLEEENNEVTTRTQEFRFSSKEQAEGLYRSITEKYEFFVSDHVRAAVLAQNVRGLKGSIASLFHINSDIGKKYSFDVRRTCREVQEATRRSLYKAQLAQGATNGLFENTESVRETKDIEQRTKEELMDKLNTFHEAMMCKVCMDASINTALLPCGHLFCADCSVRLEECPNCRNSVDQRNRIFLPNVEDITCHTQSSS